MVTLTVPPDPSVVSDNILLLSADMDRKFILIVVLAIWFSYELITSQLSMKKGPTKTLEKNPLGRVSILKSAEAS